MLIYKILSEAEWSQAEHQGQFDGSGVDLRDGYIHFSTATQVRETAAKHFSAHHGLVLLAVDTERLGSGIRWEPSRGGALFPHLYGSLTLSAVAWVSPLPVGADGFHVFPKEWLP